MQLGPYLVANGIISEAHRNRVEEAFQRIPPKRRAGRLISVVERELGESLAAKCTAAEERRMALLDDTTMRAALDVASSGSAVLFVGAGLSLDRRGRFSGQALKERLLKKLGSEVPKKIKRELAQRPLQDVAEVLIRKLGAEPTQEEVKLYCQDHMPRNVLPQHQILARLRCFRYIVTTNWDRLIESALGGSCSVIRRSDDVSQIGYTKPYVLKIHGDYDLETNRFEVNPRLSSGQIAALAHEEPALHSLLGSLFVAHPVVVLGFGTDDYNFTHFLRFANRAHGSAQQPIYVIDPEETLSRYLTGGPTNHVKCNALDFLDALEVYVSSGGRGRGRWLRGSRHEQPSLGAIAIHGGEECDLARRLGRVLRGVDRIDLTRSHHSRDSGLDAKSRVGRLAADVARQTVRPRDRVAVSCGSTLEAFADEADDTWDSFRGVSIYSASVPITDECTSSAPISLAATFARRLAGLGVTCHAHQLPLDFLLDVADPDVAAFIPQAHPRESSQSSRDSIERYLDAAGAAQVFVLGVGATDITSGSGLRRYLEACIRAMSENDRTRESGRLDTYVRALQSVPTNATGSNPLNYIGDVMYWLFKPIRSAHHTRPLEAIEKYFMTKERLLPCLRQHESTEPRFTEFLARIYCQVRSVRLSDVAAAALDPNRTVIVAASGAAKAESVLSLCNAGLVNALVLDTELADAILAKASEWSGVRN